MRRGLTVVLLVTALASVAHAEVSVAPYVGTAIGRYSESASGLRFSSDLQPFLFIGAEAEIPVGEGTSSVLVAGQAGLGTDVHMDAVYMGEIVQNNRFEQQIYEGGARYRWPGRGSLVGEIGYRFTLQRLHFSEIVDAQGNSGLVDGATEVVTVHAIESGIGWRVRNPDGSARRLLFTLGLTRGSAENDQIEGEDFSAIGIVFRAVAAHRWASGLELGGVLAWRQQNGSDSQVVTVNGMQANAVWPKNVTWMLGASLGYAF